MKPAGHRSPSPAEYRRYVFLFFVCFFVLLSSGRLGSSDAAGQLQSAELLATTGKLGTVESAATVGWVPSTNGLVYEAHDVGALALMLPGAWVAAKLSHASNDELFRDPPVIAKVITALIYALVSAIGATYLCLLLARFYGAKQAFVLSLLFASGTFYLPYAKVAWDVAPAAAMMCVFLYCLHETQRVDATQRIFAATGLALALLCSFRFSLVPFMAVTLACLAWPDRARWSKYVVLGATFLACMLPDFIYNFVRTGSLLRPATATAFYLNGNNSLAGNIPAGLLGLFFSGNHGVVFYAPPLLLALLLPIAWRGLARPQQKFIAATMAGSVLYLLLIAKMVNWGAFGWGPRYLLPVLPIWFIAAAPGFMVIKSRLPHVATALVIIAAAWNLPAATVNWNTVVAEFPNADIPEARGFYSIDGIWTGFWQGLRGQPLNFAKTEPGQLDNAARRFPDIWTARLIEKSATARMAGIAIVLILLGGMSFAARGILRAAMRKSRGSAAVYAGNEKAVDGINDAEPSAQR
ncbi:hypothetical protein [uncultured Caballeronia sp.]|jgi:hypothetical protein|uniref:hypothetical protein n=1 Tax=uncultured Caballeronia sp. TaxID=1827198 RepID=UPI0015769C56